MNYRPCEHIAASSTLLPFATFTYVDIASALCPECLAELIVNLGSVLTPAEIGAALAFHSGASATRQRSEDCITLTHDLLRSDAAGDKARAELKAGKLKAQRLRTLGRGPTPVAHVIPPEQRTAVA